MYPHSGSLSAVKDPLCMIMLALPLQDRSPRHDRTHLTPVGLRTMNIPHQLQAIDCMAGSLGQRRLIELLASQNCFYCLGSCWLGRCPRNSYAGRGTSAISIEHDDCCRTHD